MQRGLLNVKIRNKRPSPYKHLELVRLSIQQSALQRKTKNALIVGGKQAALLLAYKL